jgi:CheY-like chemotaxis protein
MPRMDGFAALERQLRQAAQGKHEYRVPTPGC